MTKVTEISLPGSNMVIQEWGEESVEAMLMSIRSYARRQKEIAEQILAAPDEDFRVRVRKHTLGAAISVLQEGRSPDGRSR